MILEYFSSWEMVLLPDSEEGWKNSCLSTLGLSPPT
jgi:hypothetical protein